MWQVSGRSDITDFEEVIRLDTELNTSITTNLGYYIKAEELDEFQKFIEQGVKSGNIK